MSGTVKAPWWFWIISILLLLWNIPSGYDYYNSVTVNSEYLNQLGDEYAPAVKAFLSNLPMWVKIVWGAAVIAALVGPLLLLLCKASAVPVFTFGLGAMIINFLYQIFIADIPELPTAAKVMTVIIMIVAVFEVWFSRKMRTKGILR